LIFNLGSLSAHEFSQVTMKLLIIIPNILKAANQNINNAFLNERNK